MRGLAYLVAVAAFAPANALAGWNTISYTSTFQVLSDIRNTLTRHCVTYDAALTDKTASRIEDACAPVFDGTTVTGTPVFVRRSYDELNLISTTRWTFALGNDTKAYLFSLIDETRHTDNTRSHEGAVTATRMEVAAIERASAEAPPLLLTAANAWRGAKAGQKPRAERDPPDTRDGQAGLYDAISALYSLRSRVRETYRIR